MCAYGFMWYNLPNTQIQYKLRYEKLRSTKYCLHENPNFLYIRGWLHSPSSLPGTRWLVLVYCAEFRLYYQITKNYFNMGVCIRQHIIHLYVGCGYCSHHIFLYACTKPACCLLEFLCFHRFYLYILYIVNSLANKR